MERFQCCKRINLNEIAKRFAEAGQRGEINDGDYQQDGLWHCGKCRTPKQCRIQLGDIYATVFCICKCEQERIDREKEIEKRKRIEAYHNWIVENSYMDAVAKSARFANAEVNADNERNMKVCKAYAEQFEQMERKNEGLFFKGDVGTGKTYAAACIANELLDRNIPVVLITAAQLMTVASLDDDGVELNRILNVPLLIVDDLGVQRNTSYANERMYDIINRRYQTGKPMIVTTNATDDMSDDITYQRIYDRIRQMCVTMAWKGESWRKKQQRDKRRELEEMLGI